MIIIHHISAAQLIEIDKPWLRREGGLSTSCMILLWRTCKDLWPWEKW